MNLLFDFKSPNGDVLEGVYFIQYQRPIKAGIGSRIISYVNDSLKCFKGNDEVVNFKMDESELVRVYYEESSVDVTEQFIGLIDVMNKFPSPFSMSNSNPLARKVVILD